MKTFALIASVSISLLQLGCSANYQSQAASRPAAEMTSKTPEVVLASPGRVEGRSETVEIGAAIDGVLTAVYVKDGDRVAKDTLLAEIGCPNLRADLQTHLSEAESARQVRARLVRGSRNEERLAAEQRSIAAKAVLEQATIHLGRTKELVRTGTGARSLLDEAQRDYDVAEAKLREAGRQEELVKAPPMAEDLAKADADIRSAETRVDSVVQQLSKCQVKAPITGTILRVLLRPGETFSTIAPKPLFTIADLSKMRVRAEVDEKDVTKVSAGQRVIVTTDSHQGLKLKGVVARVASTMGRKKILTGDPMEKADRDVLEVMVDLDENANQLPLGLRVVVQFTGPQRES